MIINNAVGLRADRNGTGRSSRVPVLLLMLFSAVLLALTTLGSALAPRAEAAADSFILRSNERLGPGQRLVSSDGRYVLVMQGDGNLVEYAPGNRAIWASGTNARDSVVRMQSDGNVVIIAPGNRPVWATGTNGNPGATLELQSDANLVVYAQGHSPRWASSSAQTGTTLGDRIVSVARAEAANTSRNYEWSKPPRNGKPRQNDCNFYSAQLDSRKPCHAWCADFARWVWGQAGASTARLDAMAASFVNYPTWHDGNSASAARAGDAVVFKNEKGVISHVGLVVAVNRAAGTITTIEGNTKGGNVRLESPFTPKSRNVFGFASPVG